MGVIYVSDLAEFPDTKKGWEGWRGGIRVR